MTNFTSHWRSALCVVLLLAGGGAGAQIHLVKDLYTDPASGYVGGSEKKLVVGSYLYFQGISNLNGKELWRTDGTEQGTVMVRDINPGWGDSQLKNMTDLNGTLYFVAFSPQHGQELWRSDGSSEGTVMVKDIHEGYDDSDFQGEMAVLHDSLFFFIKEGSKYQLWTSPYANTGGTVMLKEFASNNYEPYLIVSGGSEFGRLFFAADIGNGEIELWTSNGTAAGTVVIDDIEDDNSTNVSSTPMGLTDVNGMVYFSASTPKRGRELWRSDGTSVGSWDLWAGAQGSSPNELVSTNGNLYFIANNGTSGWELWVYKSAIDQLSILNVGPGSANADIFSNTEVGMNGFLYFMKSDNTYGAELWRSDGTEAGTFMIDDLKAGGENSWPRFMTMFNGYVYFSAENDATAGLFRTDGTKGSTEIIHEGSSSELIRMGDQLYFWAYDDQHGLELWASDGTPGNTRLLKDINAGTDGTYQIQDLKNINGTLYFTHNYYDGLLKTDGTEAGTVSIAPPDGFYSSLTATAGGLYYVLEQYNVSKYTLYKSDGSATGVALTDELVSIRGLREIAGKLYFIGDDGVHGEELWISNGTVDGTHMVKDINPGSGSSLPVEFFSYNNAVYFRATDGTHGAELWKCEGGTELGTVMVKDINPGSAGGTPFEFRVVNGVLYFNAMHHDYGQELWRSNGEEEGTFLVKDIVPVSNAYGSPTDLKELKGALYFIAGYLDENGAYGRALWKSNGTENGTVMVKGFGANVFASEVVQIGDVLYFFNWEVNAPNSVTRLWKSDGTAEGTQPVMSLPAGVGYDYIFEHQGHVFFTAGGQLWKSDGDACNTFPVNNENEVAFYDTSSAGYPFVGVGDKLYFTGISGANGSELFYYDFSTISKPNCTQSVSLADVLQKTYGEPSFTLEATATSGMPVSFASSNPAVATVNGSTVTIVGAGEVTFTATQAGDNRYEPASAQKTIVIGKAQATLAISNTTKVYNGSAHNVTATTTPANLEGVHVTYKQNGTAAEVINAGTYDVEVTLTNANYEAAPFAGTFTISKAAQSITFPELPEKVIGSAPFGPGASSGAGLSVSYTSGNDAVAKIEGDRIVIVGAGTVAITAAQNGNNNYEAATEVTRSFTVVKKTQTITFNALPEKIYGEEPFTVTASASSGLPVTFASADTNIASVNGSTVTLKGVGEVSITASQAGNAEYNAATAAQVLVVKLITGIETGSPGDVRIYPNPAAEEVILEGNLLQEGTVVQVRNALGELVQPVSKAAEGIVTLDVRRLPSGVYFVSIVNGKQVTTQRIVKK